MNEIFATYRKTGALHHAYLIESELSAAVAQLSGFLESELGFSVLGNPDFLRKECDTFGIDDGRELKSWQSRMPVAGELKVCMLAVNSFTSEAQNALLKVFEEPTDGTHFFIIMQNADILLPTLRSRLFFIRGISENPASEGDFVSEFLRSGKVQRLALLKKIIEGKDKQKSVAFLDGLEAALSRVPRSSAAKPLKEVLKCKKYLHGRAPSVKMLLEHIALMVP